MAEHEHNFCYEAFTQMCERIREDQLLSISEAQYWIFEQGYRSAVEAFLQIAEQGKQSRQFTSPKLQALAELILSAKQAH